MPDAGSVRRRPAGVLVVGAAEAEVQSWLRADGCTVTAARDLDAALDAGHDLDRVLHTDDLVRGENVFFVATGITDGELLRGVRYRPETATTQSLVMRSRSGTIRQIDSTHRLSKLRAYSAVDFDRGK